MREQGHRAMGHRSLLTLFSGHYSIGIPTTWSGSELCYYLLYECTDHWGLSSGERQLGRRNLSFHWRCEDRNVGRDWFGDLLGRLENSALRAASWDFTANRASQTKRERNFCPTVIRICVDSVAALKFLEADTAWLCERLHWVPNWIGTQLGLRGSRDTCKGSWLKSVRRKALVRPLVSMTI